MSMDFSTSYPIGTWQSGYSQVSLYLTDKQSLLAVIDKGGNQRSLDSSCIKCGLYGNTAQDMFIQKIQSLAKESLVENIAVIVYPFEGKAREIWVFEASKMTTPWLRNAKAGFKALEYGGKGDSSELYHKILKNFEMALKIQIYNLAKTEELQSAILYIQKELLLLNSKNTALFLHPEDEVNSCQRIVQIFEEEEDMFFRISEYLNAFEEKTNAPYRDYLAALLHENEKEYILSAHLYLNLAEKHPSPLSCLKRVELLIALASEDFFAFPDFLEKTNRNLLITLKNREINFDLEKWILQKDAIRLTFESHLAELDRLSDQKIKPNCFISFAFEDNVSEWLKFTFIPDLVRAGIQPLISLNAFSPDKELENSQHLIRHADQVLMICTPLLKKKYDEKFTIQTGLAQEIKIASERFYGRDKYGTFYPFYFKGDRLSSCPSIFSEDTASASFKAINGNEFEFSSYYSQAIEFFGRMRGISSRICLQLKNKFINKVEKILAGEIDLDSVENWRRDSSKRNEELFNEAASYARDKLALAPQGFMGRQKEPEELHQAYQNKARVALVENAGVGKTALALKYAEERLTYRKIALERNKARYLFILDGFDELASYLPEQGSRLLLTSRVLEHSEIRKFEFIEPQLFNIQDSIDYLLKVTGFEEREHASRLADMLGHFPLALNQAAAYVRNQRLSFEQYIDVFNKYQFELFKGEPLVLTKEKETILTTWKISIEAIERNLGSSLGQEILEFFAFLAQAPVPLFLIESWFDITHSVEFRPELVNALGQLLAYSMVSSSGLEAYGVHPLVQMTFGKQQEAYQQAFEIIMLQVEKFNEDDVTTWDQPKLCIPHGMALLEKVEYREAVSLETQYKLIIAMGKIYQLKGDFRQALKLSQECLEVARKWSKMCPDLNESHDAIFASHSDIGLIYGNLGDYVQALYNHRIALKIGLHVYGKNHSSVAKSYNNIGLIHNKFGDYEMALEFYQKALEIQIQLLGENHPEVARSYNNVGEVYYHLEDYDRGFELYQKDLNISPQVLGKNHPNVAISYDNIGTLYNSLGEYKKALEFHKKALTIWLQIFGENHPDVATSYSSIGLVYDNLGDYEMALEFHQKALEIQIQLLGENHPEVARSYNNVGEVYYHLEDYDKAFEFYQKDLNISQQVLGENHPNVAISYDNMGTLYSSLGEYKKALEFHKKALTIWLQIFGENHPEVATSYSNIGLVYDKLGDYRSALEFFQKALKIQFQVLGENHLDVAKSYDNIGSINYNIENYGKALEFHQKALKIQIQVFGENHLNVARSYNKIGEVYSSLDEYDKALEFHQKALKIQLEMSGESYHDLAISYNNMGTAYKNLKRYDEALEFFQKALKVNLEALGENHVDVAKSYDNIGSINYNIGRYDKALEFYQKALKIARQLLGENHPNVAKSYNNIGMAYKCLGDYDKALEFFQKNLKIWLQVLGENHPDTATSYKNIGWVYSKIENYDKALESYQKALVIQCRVLGENHPDLAISYNNLGFIYINVENFIKALDCYQKAFVIFCKVYKQPHPNIINVLKGLVIIVQKLQPSQLNALSTAYSLCVQTLGDEHEMTQKLGQLISSKNPSLLLEFTEKMNNSIAKKKMFPIKTSGQWKSLRVSDLVRPHYLGSFVCNILGDRAYLYLKGQELTAEIYNAKREIILLNGSQIKGGRDGCMPLDELILLVQAVATSFLFASYQSDTLRIFARDFQKIQKNQFLKPRTTFPAKYFKCLKRIEALNKLQKLLQEKQIVILLNDPSVPLKKIGKTEVATQYFEDHQKDYAYAFWIQAFDPWYFKQGIEKMAQTLQIPTEKIREWLCDNTSYLIVFDGMEDHQIIEFYLPFSPKGHIIITSRVPFSIDGSLKISLFTPEEGVAFLSANAKGSQEDAQRVAQSLGYVPSSLYRAIETMEIENLALSNYLTYCQVRLNKHAKKAEEISNLPLRNKDFVGREPGLVALEESFSKNKPVVLAANVGLGEIGKTQIAIQYAYRTCPNYNLIWWINCENIQLSYDDLAKRLGIQLADEEKKQENALIKSVNLYLERKPGWLLIFDNAQDGQSLEGLLPQSGGHILITSRNPSWDKTQTEVFEIEVFKREESIDFILKVTQLYGQEKEADLLAYKLQDLPLALAQASAYIRETKISIQEYIDDFERFHNAHWKREEETNNYEFTVNVTWNISMEKIQEIEKRDAIVPQPIALPLMQICSFFAPNDIPREALLLEWLKVAYEANQNDKSACLADLDQTLKLLKQFSMICVNETFISMHALVQVVVRDRLSHERQQEVYEQAFVVIAGVMRELTSDNVTTWDRPKLCLSHGMALFERRELMDNVELSKQCYVVSKLEEIYRILGDFRQALELDQRGLIIAEKWLLDDSDCEEARDAVFAIYNQIALVNGYL